MKTSVMTRNKGQVYSVGNYLMTGKMLGKGHFARVEEATHRIIGKKVAIKVIDLTCIKEEYARRNLHREPTVMARLRHPCIAALYETMMHGPRLYVVMEAACGGDLCALVLGARGVTGGMRGLPEARARGLAAQLVSAVRHMHVRGVVHRDLKMENIMLDSSKMFIKIVDFGLSNVWSSVGGLHTPCGSLEYAAPELFRDTRRYGPELDLWSIGVIVYGMVTGALPFVGAEGGAGGAAAAAGGGGRSRPQLRAAIARGFSRKHRAALAAFSPECKTFIQQLLEPNVETRMKIEEAARHRWLKKPGMRMKTHPLGDIDLKTNREILKQISELCSTAVVDVISSVKSEPYGSVAGMYNISAHLSQLGALPAADPLWGTAPESRPASPPEYRPHPTPTTERPGISSNIERPLSTSDSKIDKGETKPSPLRNIMRLVKPYMPYENGDCLSDRPSSTPDRSPVPQIHSSKIGTLKMEKPDNSRPTQSYNSVLRSLRPKPVYKVCENGDGVESRLPSIAEHRKLDAEARWPGGREAAGRRGREGERRELARDGPQLYRRAADALPNWRAPALCGAAPRGAAGGGAAPRGAAGGGAAPRGAAGGGAATVKRASLGSIVSPHSSANSHCKSERAMPVGWYSTRSTTKDTTPLQRLRRTAPIK